MSQSFGADLASPPVYLVAGPVQRVGTVDPLLRPDSILVFGGLMSTGNLGSTLIFNENLNTPIKYDNNIVGAAYARDWRQLGYGFVLGGEVGIADRFGNYQICCNSVVKSSSILNSGELWVGLRIRHEGFVLFDKVRIAGSVTPGFSFTTNSIGRERERELDYNGSGRALFFLAPELSLSMVDHPEWELVYRVQHRSGANGTLGKLREGSNANVLGIRYSF